MSRHRSPTEEERSVWSLAKEWNTPFGLFGDAVVCLLVVFGADTSICSGQGEKGVWNDCILQGHTPLRLSAPPPKWGGMLVIVVSFYISPGVLVLPL